MVKIWSLGEDVFFQSEDDIRDVVGSRGLGDEYKRKRLPTRHPGTGAMPDTPPRARAHPSTHPAPWNGSNATHTPPLSRTLVYPPGTLERQQCHTHTRILYTSDAADE